jgi:chemotaxis protein MotA
MNLVSIGGLLIGISSVVLGHIVEGGSILGLIQPAAFLIVLGGTTGAVLLQSKPENLRQALRQFVQVFFSPTYDEKEIKKRITIWASSAKKEGTLSLEQFAENEPDPFAKRSLRLLIDGLPAKAIQDILKSDLATFQNKVKGAIKVWDAAGGYAPTIGVLAAVLGLMHVMEKLSEPENIGSGIAVAFVATVYGVGFANLIFLPIANRLKLMNQSNLIRCEMLIEAIESIGNGENALLISERLAARQS